VMMELLKHEQRLTTISSGRADERSSYLRLGRWLESLCLSTKALAFQTRDPPVVLITSIVGRHPSAQRPPSLLHRDDVNIADMAQHIWEDRLDYLAMQGMDVVC